MRRFAPTVFLFLAVSLAFAAEAQIAPRSPRGNVPPAPRVDPLAGSSRLPAPPVRRDVGDIRDRIEDARERGAISRQEARGLKREARRIGRAGRVYSRDGLSEFESRELQVRTQILRDTLSRTSTGNGRSGAKKRGS